VNPTWTSDCGTVRLWLGDCLEVMATWPDGAVDAVVTDPPYGVGLTEKTSKYSTVHKASPYSDSKADAEVGPAAVEMSDRIASCVVVTPGNRMMFDYPRPVSIGTIFSPGSGGCDPWGFGCSNPILYYGKCPYLASRMGSRPNSFESRKADPYGDGEKAIDHPCPKPIAWMEWLVRRASLEGHAIADPFMGSGTTGVAAVRLGRSFWGVELDPGYFEIAKKRIQDELRRVAFLEGNAEPKQQQRELAI